MENINMSQTASSATPMVELLRTYFGNPAALQPNEVQRLVSDLAGQRSDLEYQNQELRETQRQQEEAVVQSQTFVQAVLDAMPDMMIVIDPDYHVVCANQASRAAMASGAPDGECLMCYNVLHGRRQPCEGPGMACPLKEVMATRCPVAATHVHHDARGHEIFVDVRASPVLDDAGCVAYVVEMYRDVTEQKQTEQRLRLTQFSVDRAGDGIFWVERDARVVYANAEACRMLGYGPDEILALTVHDLDPNFPAEKWPKYWQELKQRGTLTFESQHRAKDGRLIPVELTVSYLEAEGRECNCASVRDITKRKHIEEALRESEADFRGYFENVAIGAAQVDAQGRFVRVNDRFCEITGYRREELLAGMGPLDLDHPEDREADRQRLARFLRGEAPYEAEKRYVNKDGQVAWVHVFASFVTNADGTVRYTAGVIEDITAVKRAKEELVAAKAIAEQAKAAAEQANSPRTISWPY